MEFFSQLMRSIGLFLGICGAPAVKVSLDILGQVAAGGTTPAQVTATIADIEQLTTAASKAADACREMSGIDTHSVLSPPPENTPATVLAGNG